MKVKDFVKLDMSNMMFKVVDASKPCFITRPYVLEDADKNVISANYGEYEIVGFENATKRTMILYARKL